MKFQLPFTVSPKSRHTNTIILLHGRGSNGGEFAEEFLSGKLSSGVSLSQHFANRGTKWVFPTAHARMSTVFQEELDEWFDIYSLSDPSAAEALQVEGLRESIEYIRGIVKEEMELVPAERVVLGGISQGFATAIHALLAGEWRLGGFVGLSGWLPFQKHLAAFGGGGPVHEALRTFYSQRLETRAATTVETLRTPIFLAHSCDDNTVEVEHGRDAPGILRSLGMNVQWNEYEEGGHWLSEPKGYDDLAKFLHSVIV